MFVYLQCGCQTIKNISKKTNGDSMISSQVKHSKVMWYIKFAKLTREL